MQLGSRCRAVAVVVVVCLTGCGPGWLNTVAGNDTAAPNGDGGSRVSAWVNPSALAYDSAGDLYLAEPNAVRRVDHATGVITTVAGRSGPLFVGYGGDGHTATSARLNAPQGIAVDAAGDLYIADTGNNRVRRVDHSTGVITTAAGTGTAGGTGDHGPATGAQLSSPEGLDVDAAGNVYIADTGNNRVRRISPGGTITTIAGTGTAGISGGNGPATSAQLSAPTDVQVDSSGDVYVADSGNARVRKVLPDNTIVRVLGGSSCTPFVTPAYQCPVVGLTGVAVAANGDVYAKTTSAGRPGGGSTLELVHGAAHTVLTVESYPPGEGNVPDAPGDVGIAVGPTGLVAIGERNLSRAVVYDPVSTSTSTYVGERAYEAANDGNGGPATSAVIGSVSSIAPAPDGGVWFLDEIGGANQLAKVRHLGTDGTLTAINRFQGSTIESLAVAPDGSLIGSTGTQILRSTTAQPAGVVIAGTGTSGFGGDGGPATSALLGHVTQVAVDASGNIFLDDHANLRIRRIDASSGVITTVAGCGWCGTTSDNVAATTVTVDPSSFAVSPTGDVYFIEEYPDPVYGDPRGAVVRRVDHATDEITRYAGNGGAAGFSGDGGPALAAAFLPEHPGVGGSNATFGSTLAVDSAGFVYVNDAGNERIRRIDPATHVITTIAGGPGPVNDTDPGGVPGIGIVGPVAAKGTQVWFADLLYFRVRTIDTPESAPAR